MLANVNRKSFVGPTTRLRGVTVPHATYREWAPSITINSANGKMSVAGSDRTAIKDMPDLRRDGSLAQVNREGCCGRTRHPASVHRPAPARLSAYHRVRLDAVHRRLELVTGVNGEHLGHLGARHVPVLDPTSRPAWSGRSSRCRWRRSEAKCHSLAQNGPRLSVNILQDALQLG